MLKKIVLMVMVVTGLSAIPNYMFAKEASNSVNDIAVMNDTTTYTGTMTVTMGTLISTIIHTTDAIPNGNNLDLFIDKFQIGSMPGTIEVDAKNVVADGVARIYSEVVTLTIGSLVSTYSAEIAVTVYNATTLVYTINVLEAEYDGAPFIAIVNFSGTAL